MQTFYLIAFILFCDYLLLLGQVTSIKQEFDQAESELNLSRSKMKECDSQISHIAKEQQMLQQNLSDANVERKKLENEVNIMGLYWLC